MKYRPIVKTVEAYQYTGHNAEEFVDMFGAEPDTEGDLLVALRDDTWFPMLKSEWLVIEPNGRRSIISDANFKFSYEPAE